MIICFSKNKHNKNWCLLTVFTDLYMIIFEIFLKFFSEYWPIMDPDYSSLIDKRIVALIFLSFIAIPNKCPLKII